MHCRTPNRLCSKKPPLSSPIKVFYLRTINVFSNLTAQLISKQRNVLVDPLRNIRKSGDKVVGGKEVERISSDSK